MTQILVDGINFVSFVNGILRIECASVNREGKLSPSGTLLIPGAQAGAVLQSIANAAQEIEKRQREQLLKDQQASSTPAA